MSNTLESICTYRNEKADVAELKHGDLYISTEDMIPNRGGISPVSSIPNAGKVSCFYKGDTLVSNIRPYFKKVWYATHNGFCSNDVLTFRPSDISRSHYLYWLLSDDTFFNYVMATSKGTKMPRGDKAAIMNYPIPQNSGAKQHKIEMVLDPIQSKIEMNSKINGYLEDLLDVQFSELLASADGAWSEASLLGIATYKNGLAMQNYRPGPDDKGLPVLKIRELRQGGFSADTERCRSDIDESVHVHDGDLVFSWSGTLLLDFWAGGDAGLNQHLFKVTSDTYPTWFFYMWTKHYLQRFIAMAKDRATTMGHIKRNALANAKVIIPPAEILSKQTKIMQPIVDEIIRLKTQSKKLASLRDALLPELMSGEIDVSKVELPTQLNSHLSECQL